MLFFRVYTNTNPRPFRSIPVAQRQAPAPFSHHPNPFIINTYTSLSKQAALTTCRMNTYEKQGRGVLRLTEYFHEQKVEETPEEWNGQSKTRTVNIGECCTWWLPRVQWSFRAGLLRSVSALYVRGILRRPLRKAAATDSSSVGQRGLFLFRNRGECCLDDI